MNPDKRAQLQHPIDPLLADRWSPYVFEPRSVSREDMASLFEAVRWAPSSYNEQPWRYLVATQDQPAEFEKLLSCLVEANQVWAKSAWILALGVASTRFSRNAKENRTAYHDLGLGSASLCVEATKRGLSVHQMSGILPDRARDLYKIPEGFDVHTALAIGYEGSGAGAPESLRERDHASRSRLQLSEFVFTCDWENAWAPS